MTDDDRISKLPRWAQLRITNAERDLASARAELTAGPQDADAFVTDYIHGDRPIGRNPRIRFELPDHPGQRYIEVRMDGEVLEVRTSWGGLAVHPQASNVVRIEVPR